MLLRKCLAFPEGSSDCWCRSKGSHHSVHSVVACTKSGRSSEMLQLYPEQTESTVVPVRRYDRLSVLRIRQSRHSAFVMRKHPTTAAILNRTRAVVGPDHDAYDNQSEVYVAVPRTSERRYFRGRSSTSRA